MLCIYNHSKKYNEKGTWMVYYVLSKVCIGHTYLVNNGYTSFSNLLVSANKTYTCVLVCATT